MFHTSRMLSKALQYSALVLLLVFGGTLLSVAQSATSGAISGTVTDAGGALLPNAQVTVTSLDTHATRQVKSNSAGEFRISDLAPGTYSATIIVDGFQTSVTKDILVSVGGTATIMPKLAIGAVTDKIEVTDEAPAMHINDSGITSTIDQATIDNLPINGRRYSDFALLTPGVVSASDGFGLLSFRGISYLLNNTTIDGADDNQAYFSEARGRTRASYRVTVGAVQEFQVNTSNYSAEYGRAAGGVINTVTKSGSNELHGEAFFYDRDNALGGASNPYTQIYNFDPVTGIDPQNVKPKDTRKQFGFAIGGAIIKDKLFWFYAYDRSQRNFPGIARTTDPYDLFATAATSLTGAESCVPDVDPTYAGHTDYGAPYFSYTSPDGKKIGPVSVTANLANPPTNSTTTSYPVGYSYQGNFGACALATALNPTQTSGSLNYQAAAASYNQGLGILASFFGSVPRFQDQQINFPKIDWQINDRNRMTVQYDRLRVDSPNGVQSQTSNFEGRGSYGNDYVKTDVGVFRLSTVITNTIVNNFLGQYGRDMESEFPSGTLPNEKPLVNPLSPGECSAPHGGCPAGAPELSVGYGYDAAGFYGGTSALFSRFALPDERRIQLKDDVTWSYGKHTIKFGLDYNKVSDYINNLYKGYGSYDYDWAYSFIGDYLHATTGLGGANYAGANYTDTGVPCTTGAYCEANFGLYSSYSQGYTVPKDYNPTTNTGTPDNAGASSLLTTREYAGYITDNWRYNPKLTLTLGLRYEYEYVPANPTPNPDLIGSSATDGGFYFGGTPSNPDTTARPDDRNNVQPRLGFVYNILGNNKTILRGGYGMYFGRIINANIEQSYQNSGGPGSQISVAGLFSDSAVANAADCKIVFPQVVTTYMQASRCAAETNNASSHPSISYLDKGLQNPQVHEVDLAFEQSLGHGWIAAVTYMGSFGRELDSANDVNVNTGYSYETTYTVKNEDVGPGIRNPVRPHGGKPAPLPDGPTSVKVYGYTIGPLTNGHTGVILAPKPGIGVKFASRYDPHYYRVLRIASNVNSNYSAMSVQLNKRYRNGFSVEANYTWAHSLDGNPYIGTGIPGPSQLDPNDASKDYGNSSLDIRNRGVLAITYQPHTHFHGWKDDVLGGWRFAPLYQQQSGYAYTPYVSGYPGESVSGVRSANGAGSTAGRVDAIRRNQYNRPQTVKVDARIGKNFYFNFNHYGLDRVRLEFFGEVFNIANHQNITGVQNTAYNLSSTGAPSAGAPTDTTVDTMQLQPNFGTYNNSNSNYSYSPRQIQLAVRLHF